MLHGGSTVTRSVVLRDRRSRRRGPCPGASSEGHRPLVTSLWAGLRGSNDVEPGCASQAVETREQKRRPGHASQRGSSFRRCCWCGCCVVQSPVCKVNCLDIDSPLVTHKHARSRRVASNDGSLHRRNFSSEGGVWGGGGEEARSHEGNNRGQQGTQGPEQALAIGVSLVRSGTAQNPGVR